MVILLLVSPTKMTTSYKKALLNESCSNQADTQCPVVAPVRVDPVEFVNDAFDDACGSELLNFYNEFEENLQSNGLMSMGKSYEILEILYSCMKVVRVQEDVSSSESECNTEDLQHEEAWSSWYY